MEDRFSANINQAKANVAYLRDNYFNKPDYVRLGVAQDPLVGVFGPITFQQSTQWTQILGGGGRRRRFSDAVVRKERRGHQCRRRVCLDL